MYTYIRYRFRGISWRFPPHRVGLRTGSRAPPSPTGRNRWRRRARPGCPAKPSSFPGCGEPTHWAFLNGGDQQKFPITMVYNG